MATHIGMGGPSRHFSTWQDVQDKIDASGLINPYLGPDGKTVYATDPQNIWTSGPVIVGTFDVPQKFGGGGPPTASPTVPGGVPGGSNTGNSPLDVGGTGKGPRGGTFTGNSNGTFTADMAPKNFSRAFANPLNDYIDVMYNFTLGIVHHSKVAGIQTGMLDRSKPIELQDSDVVMIASTGDMLTTSGLGYFSIKSLTSRILMGHTPQNNLMADMVNMVIKLIEPHGFSFNETIRNIGVNLDYLVTRTTNIAGTGPSVPPAQTDQAFAIQNAIDGMSTEMVGVATPTTPPGTFAGGDPSQGGKTAESANSLLGAVGYSSQQSLTPSHYIWRLQLWFRGYDKNGQWHPNIPITTPNRDKALNKITYLCQIVTIEAHVNSRGSEYDLHTVPCGYQAYDPRDLVFDAIGVRTDAKRTFGSFIDELGKQLEESVLEKTRNKDWPEGRLVRKFEFIAPNFLRDMQFSPDALTNTNIENVQMNIVNGELQITFAKNIDIITMLKCALDDLPGVHKLFITQNNEDYKKPSQTWNVMFRTIESEPKDPKINDKSYTYQYIIEPYMTYKAMTTLTPDTFTTIMAAQTDRVAEMKNFGMIQRVYDFLFSNNNSEVIEFDLNYNQYYQMPTTMYFDAVPKTGGTSVKPPQVLYPQRLNESEISGGTGVTDVQLDAYRTFAFGQFASVYTTNANTGDGVTDDQKYNKSRYMMLNENYLINDMLIADMTVRGDPLWFMSSYMADSSSLAVVNGDPRIHAKGDKIIQVNAYGPRQIDYMNPNRKVGAPPGPNILAGYYQVLWVDNVFESGRFTQKLHLAKQTSTNYAQQAADNINKEKISQPSQPPAASQPSAVSNLAKAWQTQAEQGSFIAP